MSTKLLVTALVALITLVSCNKPDTSSDWAHKDLHYLYATIMENHPGMCNSLDPDFKNRLEQAYARARTKLELASDDTQRSDGIKSFVASFNDTHMQLEFYAQHTARNISCIAKCSINQIASNVHWITLPTFDPNQEQQTEMLAIIQQLPSLRTDDLLIFDIRTNGGGNSDWGRSIVSSLFGANYAGYHIAKRDAAVRVDWRASIGNLQHLRKLKQENAHAFSCQSDFMQWLTTIIEGMQAALTTGSSYVAEEPQKNDLTPAHEQNPVKASIIIIIDHGCGSAALDFIDDMLSMEHTVTLIGQTTNADSLYMECRTLQLPSKKGEFAFPIKVYRNRVRGHNEPYKPHVWFDAIHDTQALQEYIRQHFVRK